MTDLPFSELNGSQGLTGVVQGWVSPWNILFSGYEYLIFSFIVFYFLYVKMDNPGAFGVVMVALLGFFRNKLPTDQLIFLVAFTALPLAATYIKSFVKTHF